MSTQTCGANIIFKIQG